MGLVMVKGGLVDIFLTFLTHTCNREEKATGVK